VNQTTLAAAVMALCVPALAQGSMTTPPGGLTTEGSQFAYIFGWFANARFQQADGMHVNDKPAAINQIAFRLDNRAHTTQTATGRSWTRITLDISETTNYSGMGQTWAQNITTTPTRAFDSKWSWPSQTGFPLLKPDVWGGVNGQLRFPFTKPWVYTARHEILMDYVFRGGTLANNGTWSGNVGAYFYLDSDPLTTTQKPGQTFRLPAVPNQCADSGVAIPNAGAYTYGFAYSHGPNSSVVTLRNKLQLDHYSYLTAPDGAPVVHALGLGGSNGTNIGARCNPLYVDFSKPVTLVPLQTINNYGYSGQMGWAIPWDNGFANQDVYIQAAWADSRTKAFSLTSAVKVTLPDGLPPSILPRYKTAYSGDPDGSFSLTTPLTSGYYFPFTQYKTQ